MFRCFSRVPQQFVKKTYAFEVIRFCATTREDVRNIAVIAHVDHGKTTLVDAMLQQSGTFKAAKNRVMDSKDQEKERGITILAKNTAILTDDGKRRINIVDTPGHLDFSGEVERALQMVEGFILLVDAKEGVRPGTRYVLRKALALNLKPIICVNKIDKDDSAIEKTEAAVTDLILELATNEDQLDLHFMYGSGKSGYMNETPIKEGTLTPLFESIYKLVPPPARKEKGMDLQMLVAQLDQDEATGNKIAIGRIFEGSIKLEQVVSVNIAGKATNAMVKAIKLYQGVDLMPVPEASFGDLCAITLMAPIGTSIPIQIGCTVCSEGSTNIYPYKAPDEPTFALKMQASGAPWKSKETTDSMGSLINIKKRLTKEAMVNTALKLEGMDTTTPVLWGRGPLHLSVIIEDMRREGFEFELSAPTIQRKTIDGELCEPYEKLTLEIKEGLTSDVVSLLSAKMAEIGDIVQLSDGRVQLEASMAVRMMTNLPIRFHALTGGDGVLNHAFDAYKPLCPISSDRETGALISVEKGEAQDYSMSGMATQGHYFVVPGDTLYYGQIIGENTKTKFQNLGVNITKKNEQMGGLRSNAVDKLKNKRAAYTCQRFSFEDCMSWVVDDELITVTPKSIRMRKPGFAGKTSMRNFSK